MGRIMQSSAGSRQTQPEINFIHAVKTITDKANEEVMPFAEALRKGLIEATATDNVDGVPHVRVTNNSAWKILLFAGSEAIGRRRKRMLTIAVMLQHNASADIPAFLPASTYFFDQGMLSIQKYLRHFNAREDQAGVVFKMNGTISGKRYGDFPLHVEVSCTNSVNYFNSSRLTARYEKKSSAAVVMEFSAY